MKKLRTNSKEVRDDIRLHLIEISQNDDVEVEKDLFNYLTYV